MLGIISFADGVAATPITPKDFVTSITGAVTSAVSLSDIAAIVGVIIAAGIGAIVAWKFGRKGYNYLKNALTGRGGKI